MLGHPVAGSSSGFNSSPSLDHDIWRSKGGVGCAGVGRGSRSRRGRLAGCRAGRRRASPPSAPWP
eukprot:4468808-Alexandrium_andersonii.AAC.1